MLKIIILFLLPVFSSAFGKIHSKHFEFFPIAKNTKIKSLFVFYDLYVVSFDPIKKLPHWAAYRLTPSEVWGSLREERKWLKDPFLSTSVTAQNRHYKKASQWNYDRGHLVPKGSFKGSVYAYQTQYMTNLVPQNRDLNRGAWQVLEKKIRQFVIKGNEVQVLTGLLYGKESYGLNYQKPLLPWPNALGLWSQIPSGFWKSISFKQGGSLLICSCIFPQKVFSKQQALKRFIVKKKDIESYSGWQFFPDKFVKIKETCDFLF